MPLIEIKDYHPGAPHPETTAMLEDMILRLEPTKAYSLGAIAGYMKARPIDTWDAFPYPPGTLQELMKEAYQQEVSPMLVDHTILKAIDGQENKQVFSQSRFPEYFDSWSFPEAVPVWIAHGIDFSRFTDPVERVGGIPGSGFTAALIDIGPGFPGYRKALLEQTVEQFVLQSQPVDRGGHPDPAVRELNRSVISFLDKAENSKLREFFIWIPSIRSDLTSTHFVDLFARAMQFYLRQHGVDNYANYYEEDWMAVLQTIQDDKASLDSIGKTILNRSVATHIPRTRYRGLAAICGVLSGEDISLRVADWGCSLNLGLPGILDTEYQLGGNLTGEETVCDETDGKNVTNWISSDRIKFARAIGIDQQDMSAQNKGLAWVKACSYFRDYDKASIAFDEDIVRLQDYFPGIESTYDVSVLQENLPEILMGPDGRPLDIIYASMMMYQLPPEVRGKALANAAASLKTGGMFVELRPRNEDDWFGPAEAKNVTTVRFKQKDGTLSKEHEFLLWDTSRCHTVWEGQDFAMVEGHLVQYREQLQNE